MKKGIDVSSYQPIINYQKVKDQGIEFVIIRCGYGKNQNQKDKYFETHYEGFKKVGIKVGVYLYSYSKSIENSKLEAENCLSFIRGKKLDFPVFYDLEDEPTTGKLGKNTITQMALAFCEKIKEAGFIPGVYANKYWFSNNIDHQKLIDNDIKIWFAQYNNSLTSPETSLKVDMWQYSSSGKIEGIQGNVDLNYCMCECVENKKEMRYLEGSLVRIKCKPTGGKENDSLMIEIADHQYWKKEAEIYKVNGIYNILGYIAYKDQEDYIISFKIAHNSYDNQKEEQIRLKDEDLI